MTSNGTGRIAGGIVATAISGLLLLRGLFVLVVGASLMDGPTLMGTLIGFALWACVLAAGILLILRGAAQRRAYLSGAHSTAQRSADLS